MYNNYLIISYSMKKLIFLLFIIISTSAFAQKMEHGILIGGGLGIPMQDSKQLIPPTNELRYDHNLKGNGMIGYRFRFLPERKSPISTFLFIHKNRTIIIQIPEKEKNSVNLLCPYP